MRTITNVPGALSVVAGLLGNVVRAFCLLSTHTRMPTSACEHPCNKLRTDVRAALCCLLDLILVEWGR